MWPQLPQLLRKEKQLFFYFILSGLNDRWRCRLLGSQGLIAVLNKDTLCSRPGFFIAHSLCPPLAGGHFYEAIEVLLHISWLTVVFTSAQHPPLSSWMCRMVAAISESLWYRTQQGSDSITFSKQTANMNPACYHFSLIVMSKPLKATPPNVEGASPPSYVRLSVAAYFRIEV